MQLRDQETAAKLAAMRKQWAARLFPAPELSTARAKPPRPSKEQVKAQKSIIWAAAQKNRKPSGACHTKHKFPALDYAAWCAEVAAYMAEPRSMEEVAQHFDISGDAVKRRLYRARVEGHWPPAGSKVRTVFSAGGKKRFVVGVMT